MSAPAESYARDGFLIVPAILDAAAVGALRELGERLLRDAVAPSRQVLYIGDGPAPERPGMDSIMTQWFRAWSRLPVGARESCLTAVRSVIDLLLGSGALPFQDVLLHKLPEQADFPWHADAPFWPIDQEGGAVCWVALDDVDARNGALELAVASHRKPPWPAIDLHTGEAQTGGVRPEVTGRVRVATLSAGDAVVFDARCVHRSGRNTFSAPRRAWASSWVPSGSRWSFCRASRHPVRVHVNEGEEVLNWSELHYRHGPA